MSGEPFPLHAATKKSDIDSMKELIAGGTVDINQIDKLKRTALHMAAWNGCLEAVQVLLRSNASTELKAMDGFTALHFVSQSNSDEAYQCIKLLIKKDKSLLNQRITKGNKSALHLAILKGNEKSVSELLQLGADVSAKTSSGQLAIDLAKNNKKIIEIIENHIKSVSESDSKEPKKEEDENSESEDNNNKVNNKKRTISEI